VTLAYFHEKTESHVWNVALHEGERAEVHRACEVA
jgi:hypothetical protein